MCYSLKYGGGCFVDAWHGGIVMVVGWGTRCKVLERLRSPEGNGLTRLEAYVWEEE